MSCNDNLKLNNVCYYGETRFINMAEINLKARLDWGLLCIGGWTDVTLGMQSAYSADWSQLALACDCNYTDGQVWQSARKDWVYESGVNYVDADANIHNPLVPQIYVGGLPVVAGFSINYPEGRVIFDAPLASTSVVQAVHSFRNIQVYIGDSVPWWQELQRNSFRVDDSHFQKTESGDWSIGSHHRIQMPVIIIDAIPFGNTQGYSLGTYKLKDTQDILFHILAENKVTRNNIIDIIMLQGHRNICTFNCDDAAVNQALPLDCGGDIAPSGVDYDELVAQYPWCNIRLQRPLLTHVDSIDCGLFEGMVHIPLEIIYSRNC